MSITELSIKRPILVIVFFIVLGILGLFSYGNLRYELLPKVTPPYVSVTTIYAGASASEVEAGVSKPIEDALSSLEKVKRIFTISSEGVSLVWVEFQQDADADLSLQSAQRRVNEILYLLPPNSKAPILSKFAIEELPILRLAATSRLSEGEFFTLLKDEIKPKLSRVKGVASLTLTGGNAKEIHVNLDAEKLRLRGVSIVQVADALNRANLNVPTGNVKDADAQFSVRVIGKVEEITLLGNIVIATTPSGGKIFLRDVAEILSTEEDQDDLSRLNQVSAIGLFVQKQTDANSVEVSEMVRAELANLEAEYRAIGLKFDVAQDGSEFTLKAAHDVNVDLGLAIVLVALVMLVFLHSLRNSLIVMIAIPASLVSTFILMYLFGFSLNLMTLLAMSLLIGILVDDSIVVLENIYRHLEMGKEKSVAALDGRNEIGFAALAITLVDVVVFVPIALVPGLVGNILREFSLVVVFSTLMSLIVSFTLTPMLASRFAKLEHASPETAIGRFVLGFERFFHAMQARYGEILRWSLTNRSKTALLAFGLFIGSFFLPALGFIGGEFMPATDKGELSVILELPAGTKLEQTNRVTKKIEDDLSRLPEVRKVLTTVGASGEAFIGIIQPNNAEMSIVLAPKNERTKSLRDIEQLIKETSMQTPGVKVRINRIGIFGTGNDAPIQIFVNGANRDSIRLAAERIADTMRQIKGTADIRLTGNTKKKDLQVDIDPDKVASFGLSTSEVGTAVRYALTGYDDLKFQQGNSQLPIRVRFDERFRNNTDAIKTLAFPTPNGSMVELQQVAQIREVGGEVSLERKEREASVTIYSQAVGRPSGDIGNDIKAAVESLALPSGIKVVYSGDLELQDDSSSLLGLAFLAAILFMYLVMVALYNSWVYPFVVLFSIPVAMVGALLALALTMNSLNIFTIMGMIMMTGLVAKNAILLVDRANERRAHGADILSALIDAGETRFRPILMTTLAMVIGMMPIAFSQGAGSEWKSGLAWVLIGGLSSSMLLTLVVVPTIYVDIDRLKTKLATIVQPSKRQAHAPEQHIEEQIAK